MPESQIPDEYETFEQAAKRTGYSYGRIRRRAAMGELPIFLPPGAKIPKLVKKSDVDALMQVRPEMPANGQTRA